MDASVVFGILGNVVGSLLFLSPLNTFWRIVKHRSTEEFESIPYIFLLLHASQWAYYGIIKSEVLLVTINGFGSLMMIIYLIIFLIYSPPKMKIKTAALMAVVNVGFLLAVVLVTSLAMDKVARINTVGTLCVLVTIISFGSPLAIIKTVVTTKSVEFMPFFLTFFYFLVGTTWSIYAILLQDTFILIPNGIGFLLGVAQLVLYAWYSNPWSLKKANDALEEGSHHEHLIAPSSN